MMMISESLIRLSAVALGILIVALAAFQLGSSHDNTPSLSLEIPEAPTADPEPLRAELKRCRLMATPNDACRRLWQEGRDQFLGQTAMTANTSQ
ncbi:putative entry exclusion protein TrbK-alt [Asticcacaulis endophyticus]|uniref:Conjugative transfer region protein TrbK n=1 Tax=Asticcacaulis endophyticus TaxID=1395890 RepID=A0A918Q3G0_9CAUL|nr:putative entry exclusion protein TrbK-alt [Asticcacaulis endophyticus]GGZ32268.1 hypothetical protein GCM10011273_17960 [Asticcacaulis endophyticus]